MVASKLSDPISFAAAGRPDFGAASLKVVETGFGKVEVQIPPADTGGSALFGILTEYTKKGAENWITIQDGTSPGNSMPYLDANHLAGLFDKK